jgi:hypothetical protein
LKYISCRYDQFSARRQGSQSHKSLSAQSADEEQPREVSKIWTESPTSPLGMQWLKRSTVTTLVLTSTNPHRYSLAHGSTDPRPREVLDNYSCELVVQEHEAVIAWHLLFFQKRSTSSSCWYCPSHALGKNCSSNCQESLINPALTYRRGMSESLDDFNNYFSF